MGFQNAANKARAAKSHAGSARTAATTSFEREIAQAVEDLAAAVAELARAINLAD